MEIWYEHSRFLYKKPPWLFWETLQDSPPIGDQCFLLFLKVAAYGLFFSEELRVSMSLAT